MYDPCDDSVDGQEISNSNIHDGPTSSNFDAVVLPLPPSTKQQQHQAQHHDSHQKYRSIGEEQSRIESRAPSGASMTPVASHSSEALYHNNKQGAPVSSRKRSPKSAVQNNSSTTAADNAEEDDINSQMRRSAQLRDAINKQLQLREEVVASQRECDKVRERLRKSEADIASQDQTIKQLHQDNQMVKEEYKKMKDQAMNVCQQWQAKSKKDEQFIEQLEQAVTKAHAEREDALREHQDAVRILHELQQSAAEESKAYKTQIQAMERALVKADGKIQDVQEQRDEFNSLVVELRRQVTAHVSRNQRLQEQMLNMQSEKDEWRSQCAESETAVATLQKEVLQLQKEQANLSQEAMREAGAFKQLAAELGEKKNQLCEMADVMSSLRQQLNDAETKHKEIQANLRLALDRSEEENVVLNSRVPQLEHELHRLKATHDTRQAEYTEEIMSQSAALHETKEGLANFKKKHEDALNRIDALEADLTEARHEVVNVQRAHQQADEEARARQEEQISALHEKIQSLIAEKDASETALADALQSARNTEEDLARQLEKTVAELTASRDQNAALSDCIKEQSELHYSSEKSADTLKTSLKVCQRELMFVTCSEQKQAASLLHSRDMQRLLQQLLTSLSQEMTTHMARLRQNTLDLQQTVLSQEGMLNKAREMQQKRDAELNDLHSNVSALRKEGNACSQERDALKSQVGALQNQCDAALREAEELRSAQNVLESKLSEAHADSRQMRYNLQHLQSKIQASEAEKMDAEFTLTGENRRLGDELAALQGLYDTAKRDRESLLAHRESLRNDVAKLQTRVAMLDKVSENTASLSAERDSALKRVQELSSLRAAEIRERDELTVKLRAVRQQLADATAQNEKQQQKLYDQITGVQNDKQSSIAALERQLSALKKDVTSKDETTSSLRRDLAVEQEKRQRGKEVVEEWKRHCEKFKDALKATEKERDQALKEKAELVQRYNRLAQQHQRLGLDTSMVQKGQGERTSDLMKLLEATKTSHNELRNVCISQQATLDAREVMLATLEAALQVSEQARDEQHRELLKLKNITGASEADVSSIAGEKTNPLHCSVVVERPLNTTEGPRRHPKKVARSSSSNQTLNTSRGSEFTDPSINTKRFRE